jgi:hypothetical protein
MPQTNYTPEIGETVFVSLSGNAPFLITVTGFHYHTYLKCEVMDFRRKDGQENWSTFKDQTFFPEIPVGTPYLYDVVVRDDEPYGRNHSYEEAWFFTPEEAFAHITKLQSGEVRSNHPFREAEYSVRVTQL